MSSQTILETFLSWEAHYKDLCMQHCWGHLAPKKNKAYSGYIVFCWGSDGTLCPIDYDFIDLDGSPWLYDSIISFIEQNAKEQFKIYRFDGIFKNYIFIGKVKEILTQ